MAKLSDSPIESGPDTFEHAPFMGSLDYAAPEQARQMANVDARADFYSLGVISYSADEKQIAHPCAHAPDLPTAWGRPHHGDACA